MWVIELFFVVARLFWVSVEKQSSLPNISSWASIQEEAERFLELGLFCVG
jgi:hypothetical protein